MNKEFKTVSISELPSSSVINDEDIFIKSDNVETAKITAIDLAQYVNQNNETVNGHTVESDVPSNAEFTDTKVTNTLATTTKAYVTGTTSSNTNTGGQVFDTGVYLDTISGQLNATTYTENGTLLNSKYKLWRYAKVGQIGQAVTTKTFYKFAEMSTSAGVYDGTITFKVYTGYSDRTTAVGILTAHFRTDLSGYWSSGELIWEYAAEGIDTSKFVLAHNTSECPTKVELWAIVDNSYRSYHFDVISEGTRDDSKNSLWDLYVTLTAGGESAITDGYTTHTSTLSTLKNNILGNAQTAAKLGDTTIGGTATPIYLDSGTATALSSTVGSETQPVYMNNGTITECSYNFEEIDAINSELTQCIKKTSTGGIGNAYLPIYVTSNNTVTTCRTSADYTDNTQNALFTLNGAYNLYHSLSDEINKVQSSISDQSNMDFGIAHSSDEIGVYYGTVTSDSSLTHWTSPFLNLTNGIFLYTHNSNNNTINFFLTASAQSSITYRPNVSSYNYLMMEIPISSYLDFSCYGSVSSYNCYSNMLIANLSNSPITFTGLNQVDTSICTNDNLTLCFDASSITSGSSIFIQNITVYGAITLAYTLI